MKIEIHPAAERGTTETGWLHSRHSFSFGDYYDPKRMGFGLLRVLNDDVVEPGQGFGFHPHDNMEIVTVMLSGALEHKDSMGNRGILRAGDVQRMSAGSGLMHSEFNASQTEPLHLLQVWVQTQKRNIPPSYEQKAFAPETLAGRLYPVVSPEKEAGSLFIHQDASFFLGKLDRGVAVSHKIRGNRHGAYLFVADGEVRLGGRALETGAGAAIAGDSPIDILAEKKSDVLLIEVPLKN